MLADFVLCLLSTGSQLFPAVAADPGEVGHPHATPVTRTGISDFRAWRPAGLLTLPDKSLGMLETDSQCHGSS